MFLFGLAPLVFDVTITFYATLSFVCVIMSIFTSLLLFNVISLPLRHFTFFTSFQHFVAFKRCSVTFYLTPSFLHYSITYYVFFLYIRHFLRHSIFLTSPHHFLRHSMFWVIQDFQRHSSTSCSCSSSVP